jgi:hypothetical protein
MDSWASIDVKPRMTFDTEGFDDPGVLDVDLAELGVGEDGVGSVAGDTL